ncbi:MAG: pentapeptide repeat-containing protein [Lachnospiraceae bacterium]|nr:pentapeptide repeat-containing protein [Lachnospiraceae bacterium]
MNSTDFEYSIIEQDAAKTLLNFISPVEDDNVSNATLNYDGEEFSADSEFEWLPCINIKSCDFFYIDWDGINGINSCLNNSTLRNCNFENCNLKYSNFEGTTFEKVIGKAISFDHSDFSNTEIFGSEFDGCSFSTCFFYNTKFSNCTFCQTEFTNAIFMDARFESIDFSKVSLKNAEFRRCHFLNCILPFFEIMHISYGLKEIFDNKDIQLKPVRTNHIVNCKVYLQEIHELLPIFFSDKDYISMANIYILEGNMTKAFHAIKHGLIYACQQKKFELVNSLCKIASVNSFRSSDLKELYHIITQNIQIGELSNTKYYHYLIQLAKVEEMLFDFSDKLSTMYITIETTYCYKEIDKLSRAIQELYKIVDLVDNNISNKIVIRHNSPPTINFILSGDFYNLIFIFAIILYTFKKSTVFIEQIQQLIKNHNDIKIQKMNLKLKEIELTRAKIEKQNQSKILLPKDYSNISYIMKTTPDYPNVLFSFDLKNNKGIPQL